MPFVVLKFPTLLAASALLLSSLRADAQRPTRRDSTRADSSTRIQPLPTVNVRVMSDQRALDKVPWAVGVVGVRELRRAQPTVTLDEALGSVPGVFVASRYNFATDSRISVRGAGARANFGLRGVKVFLDGVPQTLPDGQSQLTNVELGNIDRIEVLRGSTASLYGNGSAGVLSFSNDLRAPTPFAQSVRLLAGSFGERKAQLRTVARNGNAIGSLSLSRTTYDGFRVYSAAESRQLNGALDYSLGADSRVEIRAQLAEVPRAVNPGALTFAEYAANRDSASATNIRRGADRRVKQDQVSVSYHHGSAGSRAEYVSTTWISSRGVRNALSTAPPGTVTATTGIYSTLDRVFAGTRLSARYTLGETPSAPMLSAGVDLQQMRDRRINLRATGGRPTAATDTLILDQFETVRSAAPFVQAQWSPTPRLLFGAGSRYDRLRFSVRDLFTRDGGVNNGDNSGGRTLSAVSGHGGVTVTGWTMFAPYANVSTSFETPTTTELQARPDRAGGFNTALGPQRTVSTEIGARGAISSLASWNVAVYRANVKNAIVQSRVVDGTAYFENAGRTRNSGLEFGGSVRAGRIASINAAYTWSVLRFADYRQTNGTRVDTLDGKQLPGVPPQQLRLGFRSVSVRGFTLDADQTWTSALFADDFNTTRVAGWGTGVTNIRASWTVSRNGYRVEPFAGVLNAQNTAYVGAVTVNGAFGRVLEPAPLRNWYLGLDIGVAR
ncbi:MAG: TonB-dependent receptor [Gemmatimonadaceae bacterium]|nr:TonB-dependent receptor [Gemmatimonadaceae bacterium]